MMARVIAIGAGIAGMSVAIGLRRLNIETLIMEQATEVREIGSGISLWPNAMKAWRAWELMARFGDSP